MEDHTVAPAAQSSASPGVTLPAGTPNRIGKYEIRGVGWSTRASIPSCSARWA